ncbi:MAG: alanine--tRNA ligase [Bacteroidales bacterium]|nr:alanine--tRNA ligase [Bacteroidales bacterium]MDD3525943.1 alanine--tRNA ligase [Bacteroidales bacterium]MDD4176897.1 alanine--tRNA ligase [Bacteroidales bacterium]MDD4740966.1 alanine--tRNA ligase [Bacteroidales bacterium]MDY0336100.1 alanine--tRNA ligase [Bacteroidales bacterium]
MMKSADVRRTFLEFFAQRQHKIVPSAPMVVKNDPTLMFTNAGMNQFKDIFLGNAPAKYARIADTQKCLRVSGKHNDLDEVGHDTYHHTMFEMLGNWSFGDYFKKEAIAWAWELLTEVYGLKAEDLYVTVFGGDPQEGLAVDEEALEHWKTIMPQERILHGSKKDNFWEMGDTGPCGPCSEIHVDLRSAEEKAKTPGKQLVNNDHPQVIEIWNLVFIQYNRKADGKLEPLPAKHVDTGMGFERLTMALQGKQSNYDTDVFQPIIQKIASLSGIVYGDAPNTDVAMRVIADHLRAVAFAIADGQLPANNKAGYVIRRILRRAVRYGFTFLDFKEPFIYKLVPVLVKEMGDFFPEIVAQQTLIERVINEEEQAFLRTLALGIKRFEQYIEGHPQTREIEGAFAFELFDTFGFPIDLTQLMAREKGLTVDIEGFNRGLEEQKNRSRQAAEKDTDDWVEIRPGNEATRFVGYTHLQAGVEILKFRKIKTKKDTYYQIVLNQTPFYAESGGQVGDRGRLFSDEESIDIKDTQKENDLIIHIADRLPQDLHAAFTAEVNAAKRLATVNNHSATHLMHAALKRVLGTHVEQRGSLVDENRLRFDFSHFARMSHQEIRQVEQIVNTKIRENIPIDEQRDVPIDDAKAMGAAALFGEKYGEHVRVITFDPQYSIELCGGTHAAATGQIGMFKIVSESAIAAGVRRIEAITGHQVEELLFQQEDTLSQLREILKSNTEPIKAVTALLEDKRRLEKELEIMKNEKVDSLKLSLKEQAEKIGDVNFIAYKLDGDLQTAKNLAFRMNDVMENLVMVIGNITGDKANLTVIVSENLTGNGSLNAGQIIREIAKEIQGGGGGQPHFATAGGKNPAGIDKALQKAREMIKG